MDELIDYLEELAAFRKTGLLKYKNELGATVLGSLRVVDFYKENFDTYIIVEPGVRINVKSILDADNKFGGNFS